MRGFLAAEEMVKSPEYLNAVFSAMWIDQQNMGDIDTVKTVLNIANIDAEALLQMSETAAIKSALIEKTEAAVKRGIFGAPTMFMSDEMYFGQDRLDFIEENLQA
jgi:2-hydroxychromene-2-carboxylate isomerase